MSMSITSLLTIRQVAEQTGKQPASIRYLIKQGRLRVVRVGWNILIPRRELEKLTTNANQG
jgi:excisionase family DNA binding protein